MMKKAEAQNVKKKIKITYLLFTQVICILYLNIKWKLNHRKGEFILKKENFHVLDANW